MKILRIFLISLILLSCSEEEPILGSIETMIVTNLEASTSSKPGDPQSGNFTKEWMEECKNGQKNFLKTREKLAEHPIEKVGADLRAMMPWITKKKLVDSDKN